MCVSVLLKGSQLLHVEITYMLHFFYQHQYHQILCKLYQLYPKKFKILYNCNFPFNMVSCYVNICGEHNF